MRIPAEQFANVPVSTLSPHISPRDEERELPGSTKSLTPSTSNPSLQTNAPYTRKSSSAESAPSSPNVSRKSGRNDSNSGKRSISPALMEDDESKDEFGPEQGSLTGMSGYGPRSLPSVQSISMGLIAMKR